MPWDQKRDKGLNDIGSKSATNGSAHYLILKKPQRSAP